MSSTEERLACFVSPARARSLLTVRAAISSAVSVFSPRSTRPSLMWSYCRSRLLFQACWGIAPPRRREWPVGPSRMGVPAARGHIPAAVPQLATDAQQHQRSRGELDRRVGVQYDAFQGRRTRGVQLDDVTARPGLARQVELARLTAGVQEQEERVVGDPLAPRAAGADPSAVEIHAQRLRDRRRPVGVVHLYADGREPGDVLGAVRRQLAPLEERALPKDRMGPAQGDEARDELAERTGRPVEPRDLVVLAVRVVVATLRVRELVSHPQHRDTLRQQQCGEEVAHLPRPQILDLLIVGLALDAEVP